MLVKLPLRRVDLWNERWLPFRTVLLNNDELPLRSWLGKPWIVTQHQWTAQLLLHSQSVFGFDWRHFSSWNCFWLTDCHPSRRLIWKETNLFHRFVALTSDDDRFNLLHKCLLGLCLPVHSWHLCLHAVLYWLYLQRRNATKDAPSCCRHNLICWFRSLGVLIYLLLLRCHLKVLDSSPNSQYSPNLCWYGVRVQHARVSSFSNSAAPIWKSKSCVQHHGQVERKRVKCGR